MDISRRWYKEQEPKKHIKFGQGSNFGDPSYPPLILVPMDLFQELRDQKVLQTIRVHPTPTFLKNSQIKKKKFLLIKNSKVLINN